MAKKVAAILLDTRSIQKYIFSSNKLKTNVGASYLVSSVFEKMMAEVLKDKELKTPAGSWDKSDKIQIESSGEDIDCEIIYVGGGNMLLLLDKKDCDNLQLAKDIVGEWSKKLLLEAPGLKTGAAIDKVEFGENFQSSIDNLYKQLKENQNTVFPNTDIPYSGLTVECSLSARNADFYDEDSKKYVSAEALAKLNAYEAADKNLKTGEPISSITEGYNFTSEIDKLGQKDGDNFIAVVHIDGNDMGKKFATCSSLEQRKKLSLAVAEATKAAFGDLLKDIIREYKGYSDNTFAQGGLFKLKNNILPIRPIIMGGDDITFVCPGKAGIIYTKRFIEHLQKRTLAVYKKKGDAKTVDVPIYSCGGVAIVPTSYPFFRAYELAEELCGDAKAKARTTEGSSWLDFLVIHGEQSADLRQIRKEEYTGYLGNMHYGPYKVAPMSDPSSVERLLLGAIELTAMPNNKMKKMRDVIRKDTGSIKLFMEQLKHTGADRFMPNVENKMDRFKENLWDLSTKKTPYLDMIEAIDFIYDERKLKE